LVVADHRGFVLHHIVPNRRPRHPAAGHRLVRLVADGGRRHTLPSLGLVDLDHRLHHPAAVGRSSWVLAGRSPAAGRTLAGRTLVDRDLAVGRSPGYRMDQTWRG
jgi:hypothetical protein